MRQLPILFYAPMVRAILKGIKTNTRRVVRPQPIFDGVFWRLGDAAWSRNVKSVPAVPYHSLAARSPYGANGDRLWVKENWRVGAWNEKTGCVAVDYVADGFCREEWLAPSDENQFLRLWRQMTAKMHIGALSRHQKTALLLTRRLMCLRCCGTTSTRSAALDGMPIRGCGWLSLEECVRCGREDIRGCGSILRRGWDIDRRGPSAGRLGGVEGRWRGASAVGGGVK